MENMIMRGVAQACVPVVKLNLSELVDLNAKPANIDFVDSVETLCLLMSDGFKPTSRTLECAIERKHYDVAMYLLEGRHCDVSQFALKLTIESRREPLLAAVCSRITVKSPEAYLIAINAKYVAGVKILHKYGFKMTTNAYHRAIAVGTLDIIEYFNANGCPIPLNPVKIAIEQNRPDVIKMFISMGNTSRLHVRGMIESAHRSGVGLNIRLDDF